MSEPAAAWLSRGFEELVYDLHHKPRRDPDFDVVIVGSGYGGAIAAAELAGCTDQSTGKKIRVCVLERGKEYLPGMFPSRLADMPGHVRFSTEGSAQPRGQREGLFDMRVGPDVSALVANGLGGGSLINAGVMEIPEPDAFIDWPPQIEADLRGGFYDEAKRVLGASVGGADNTIRQHAKGGVAKFAALRGLGGRFGQFRAAAITVAMQNRTNDAGVVRNECLLCGDCATGCNYEAKESLDVNLLLTARLHGAKIFTGATVLKLTREQDSGVWILDLVHTEEKLRRRQGRPLQLRAHKVILAAGTFGSTEILLRSRSDELQFSRWLGSRFSGNGDSISAVYNGMQRVNAAGDESIDPTRRAVGPTITGIVDRRVSDGCLVEDLAIPGPLRRAFEEVVTTANTLHELAVPDANPHSPQDNGQDPCAVNADAIAHTSVVAVMSHDGAAGALELVGGDDRTEGDGAIRVRWPELRDAPFFARQQTLLRALAPNAGGNARILPNPLWQLLPNEMQFLLEGERGPAFTVHPLGGCTLGVNVGDGVVNEHGEVFRGSSDPTQTDVWPGLAVLDGSIVRSSLGTNPALTIAALALRAVRELHRQWQLQPGARGRRRRFVRPTFARPPLPVQQHATEAQFIERIAGPAKLRGANGEPLDCVVELTFHFNPVDLAALVLPQQGQAVPMRRRLGIGQGTLRVFERDRWSLLREAGASDADFDKIAMLGAPVRGGLELLHREASEERDRRCRGFRAYVCNRGLRDTWQWLADGRGPRGCAEPPNLLRQGLQRLRNALDLATRAAEVRLLEYDLQVDWQAAAPPPRIPPRALLDMTAFARNARIFGRKRLTYERRSNPWRQLMQLALVEFPGLMADDCVLELDVKYLAHEGVPLVQIVGQRDQTAAIADLASFAAYFLRLLINIHVWSFRRPDAPPPREPQRLPGVIEGLPQPEIREIDIDRLPNGRPVRVRLTRYRPRDAQGIPVVLIHGYSASGTTFAHPAVKPNLATHLCNGGRDVWIVDLRTSCGMPTAKHPWNFEDPAFNDMPAAVDLILREACAQRVDVVAHCMGAAMFSMAVLVPPAPGERFYREREDFPNRIRRAVLSQVGPVMVMSPANIFRGYIMSYLRYFLPRADYDFRVSPDPGVLDQLVDRLLATLPYPEAEFDIENPRWPCKRTPYVGTRHRMDALYGRAFSVAAKDGRARLDDKVLEHIDDLFGPMSLDTVAQTIHFAREQAITDPTGRSYFQRGRVRERWIFPTLSIHGEENGLADVATLTRMTDRMQRDAGARLEIARFPSFGHQDSLLGKDADAVFDAISEFFSRG